MNPWALLIGLILFASSAIYGVWEHGVAEHWKAQYASLQASYNAAAIKAQQDAADQYKRDLQNITQQTNAAVLKAAGDTEKANEQAAAYRAKLAKIPSNADLPHLCANTPLPVDLRPNE